MAGSPSFSDLELKIIHALQLDGRAPFSKIAGVLGVSDQTVARRYTSLRSAGKIQVSGCTDPDRTGEVAWFAIPRSRSPPLPRGRPTCTPACCAPTRVPLYTYLTTKVAALPSVQLIETAPVIETLKHL